MKRYTLDSTYRMIDNENWVFVEIDEFWYQELATGDIWTLCQIITNHGETEGESRRIVLRDDMSLAYEGMDSDELPLAVPVRSTFIPPIETRFLTLTDNDGREAATYRAGSRWLDVMFNGVSHRVNFLSPLDDRKLAVEDLEGNGNDDNLDKLKTFMLMMVAAARLWED